MPRLLIARFERRCLETRITALVTAASAKVRVKAKDFSDFTEAEARWEPKVDAASSEKARALS